MSGETFRADDFDDFILDDEPAVLGLGGLFANQPGEAAFPVPETGENEVLFGAAGGGPGTHEFGELREFSEDAMASWEGHTMQPQEIGIPVQPDEFDPLTAPVDDLIQDSGDLQLVDEESQLAANGPEDELFAEPVDADVTPAFAGDSQASSVLDSTVLVDGHFPGAVQQGEGWESIELGGSDTEAQEEPAWAAEAAHAAHEGVEHATQDGMDWQADPAAGTQWDSAAVAEDAVDAGAGAAEALPVDAEPYEQELVGVADAGAVPVEQPVAPVLPMRRRWGGMVAAAAAVLLFGTGAAVAVEPKLFGLESLVGPGLFAPAQDDNLIVTAPRPVVRPTRNPSGSQPRPSVAQPVGANPVAAAPVANEPTRQPVAEPRPVAPDPVAVVPPVVAPKEPEPTRTDPVAPVPPEPVAVVEPVRPVEPVPVAEVPTVAQQPVAAAAQPVQPYQDEVVQRTIRVNDSLQVGGFVQPEAGTPAGVADLTPGTSALAHLHNGNYFIGTVKTVDASMVTLKLDKGEVTIASGDIRKVSKLGSAEFLELQRSVSGFVRLSNNNRLVGAILSNVADDNIVLEMKSDRIILPRSAIDEIVRTPERGEVRFELGDSEEKWLQDLAERQLRAIEKERSDRASQPKGGQGQQKQE